MSDPLPFFLPVPEGAAPIRFSVSQERDFEHDAAVTHVSGRVFVRVDEPRDLNRVKVTITCDCSLLKGDDSDKHKLMLALGYAAINGLLGAMETRTGMEPTGVEQLRKLFLDDEHDKPYP